MMKKYLFIVSILFCTSAGFGQNLDNAAVHRIGDYGRLWSVINLFHPEMAYNKINADSLFTDNISRLIKDPSAANFKVAVSKMLGSLHDPYTTINDNHNKIKDTAELPDRQLIKWLSDSIAMVYFNDDFIRQNYSDFGNDTALSHLINTIKNANGIIIDLRKASRNDENKSYYEGGFMKNLISYLIEHDLSYPSYRSIVHYGHESETFDMSSFYFQGWITLNAPVVSKHRNAIHKPVCILINRFNDDIADAVAALQQGGIAKVVADGSLGNFEPVSTYSLQLSDSIKVNMRLMEIIYSNGCKKFSPDTSVNKLLYKSEDSLIHTAISFLKSGNEIKAPCVESLQNIFVNSTVNGYDSIAYPPASLRLLGLMRYWSAINYFCPNKDRLLKNWDSVLYEYAPKFLQAKDSFDYTLVVAKLITEIHDGHGRLDSKVWSSHYQKIPLVQLKYVEGKTIVYKTFIDSLKNILCN